MGSEQGGRDRHDNRRTFRANVRRSAYGHKSMSVTEHAIVRYVERIIGINVSDLCSKIIPEETHAAIRKLGDGVYPVGTTHKVRVVGGTVITCWHINDKESDAA